MKKILLALIFFAFVTVSFGATSIEAFKPKIEKTTSFYKVEVVKNVDLSTPKTFVFKEVKQVQKPLFTYNNTFDAAVVQKTKSCFKTPINDNIYCRFYKTDNYILFKPIPKLRFHKVQNKIKMHRSNFSNWTC